jgi:5'-phosphate synthase pdxT subunit
MRRVGVLALQGGYAPHEAALADLGVEAAQVRRPADLVGLDGLVLPGGESGAQLRLIERADLRGPLDAFARSGRPILATCAGLILAARRVTHPAQGSFGWLDVEVERNAWGRQVESFEAESDEGGLPLVFIRAPRIRVVGPAAQVMVRWRGEPVVVRQGAVIGAACHPELTADRRIHVIAFGQGESAWRAAS